MIETGGAAQGHAGGLDQQGARAAEGVGQGHGPIPAREANQAGGQVFLQGCQTHAGAVAAAVQAFATAIHAQSRLAAAQVHMDGEIGFIQIH